MAAASSSGATGALLALLTFGLILNFLDTGPLLNVKEAATNLIAHGGTIKHFGYGKGTLMQRFVFTAGQHQQKRNSVM